MIISFDLVAHLDLSERTGKDKMRTVKGIMDLALAREWILKRLEDHTSFAQHFLLLSCILTDYV